MYGTVPRSERQEAKRAGLSAGMRRHAAGNTRSRAPPPPPVGTGARTPSHCCSLHPPTGVGSPKPTRPAGARASSRSGDRRSAYSAAAHRQQPATPSDRRRHAGRCLAGRTFLVSCPAQHLQTPASTVHATRLAGYPGVAPPLTGRPPAPARHANRRASARPRLAARRGAAAVPVGTVDAGGGRRRRARAGWEREGGRGGGIGLSQRVEACTLEVGGGGRRPWRRRGTQRRIPARISWRPPLSGQTRRGGSVVVLPAPSRLERGGAPPILPLPSPRSPLGVRVCKRPVCAFQ